MNEHIPSRPLEPGVYQGTPENFVSKKAVTPRLLRTMKIDIAEAIKNQNETSVSIAIAEDKKKRAKAQAETLAAKQTEGADVPPAPKPRGRFIVVIVVILVMIALGLAYAFVLPRITAIKLPSISLPSLPTFGTPADTPTNGGVTPSVTLAPSLVPAQLEKQLNITSQTRTQVFAELNTESKTQIPSGSIKNLYITEDVQGVSVAISPNRLIAFTGVSVPEILTRSLEKQFMAGFWGEENGAPTPFMVLKVSSKETGLAGMLDWESTLPRFFDTVFSTNIMVEKPTTVKFRDIVMLGKDVRAFGLSSGSTLVYTFVNQNTILIAGSRTALEALVPLAVKN